MNSSLPAIFPSTTDDTSTNNWFLSGVTTIIGSSTFDTVVLIIVSVIIAFGILACCQKISTKTGFCKHFKKCCLYYKCCQDCCQCLYNPVLYPLNDDAEPEKAIFLAFGFFDYMTDVGWCAEVIDQRGGINNNWSLATLIAIGVPWVLNIFCAFIFLIWLQKNKQKQTPTDAWTRRHSIKFLIVVALTGNFEPVLQLFNSKICNKTILSMNLRYKMLYCYSRIAAIVLNCTLERFPQFVLQMLYLDAHRENYGTFSVLAPMLSFFSIVLTIFHLFMLIFVNNSFRDERIKLVFKFAYDKKYDMSQDIKYHKVVEYVFSRKKKLTKYVIQTLGFMSDDSLRCQYTFIDKGENIAIMMLEIMSKDEKQDLFEKEGAKLYGRMYESKFLLKKVNKMLHEAYQDYYTFTHPSKSKNGKNAKNPKNSKNPLRVSVIQPFMVFGREEKEAKGTITVSGDGGSRSTNGKLSPNCNSTDALLAGDSGRASNININVNTAVDLQFSDQEQSSGSPLSSPTSNAQLHAKSVVSSGSPMTETSTANNQSNNMNKLTNNRDNCNHDHMHNYHDNSNVNLTVDIPHMGLQSGSESDTGMGASPLDADGGGGDGDGGDGDELPDLPVATNVAQELIAAPSLSVGSITPLAMTRGITGVSTVSRATSYIHARNNLQRATTNTNVSGYDQIGTTTATTTTAVMNHIHNGMGRNATGSMTATVTAKVTTNGTGGGTKPKSNSVITDTSTRDRDQSIQTNDTPVLGAQVPAIVPFHSNISSASNITTTGTPINGTARMSTASITSCILEPPLRGTGQKMDSNVPPRVVEEEEDVDSKTEKDDVDHGGVGGDGGAGSGRDSVDIRDRNNGSTGSGVGMTLTPDEQRTRNNTVISVESPTGINSNATCTNGGYPSPSNIDSGNDNDNDNNNNSGDDSSDSGQHKRTEHSMLSALQDLIRDVSHEALE